MTAAAKMKVSATKSSVLTFEPDFSTASARKKTLKAYAAIVDAAVETLRAKGISNPQEAIADIAGCHWTTVMGHRAGRLTRGPILDTFSGILFACGYDEIVLAAPEKMRKSLYRRRLHRPK